MARTTSRVGRGTSRTPGPAAAAPDEAEPQAACDEAHPGWHSRAEKHPDGYVAYPVGLRGVVVAQGDTYEEALADARSAIQFHLETFGRDVLEDEDAATEVFVAETAIAV